MNRKIGIVGLGYVGLPMAVAFGKHHSIIGFDKNPKRIAELEAHHDHTGEVSIDELSTAKIHFSAESHDLKNADFIIIAVPTPIYPDKTPDLSLLEAATYSVGEQLKQGDIVVFESTVYPGVTEEVCVPILESASNLKFGKDFTVGYSPERINPGDKEHSFENIIKVVSGSDQESLAIIAEVYASVVKAGVFQAATIKVAEAAKVIENTQRDLNIALMNELAIIFDKLDISTHEVLAAAQTKWNFLPFIPGLVGGHCIGVDPYYLTYKAQASGIDPQVILAGRGINDNMGQFIVDKALCFLKQKKVAPNEAIVTVLGITFKENCPDIRNSKVIHIINILKDCGVTVQVCDPCALTQDIEAEIHQNSVNFETLNPANLIISAVKHTAFCALSPQQLINKLQPSATVMDIKGIHDHDALEKAGVTVWQL